MITAAIPILGRYLHTIRYALAVYLVVGPSPTAMGYYIGIIVAAGLYIIEIIYR
jgi:hypothetical protein